MQILDQALAASAVRAQECGFFFDFDGVLALTGANPEAIAPVSGVVEHLEELCGYVNRVAVVSGRPLQFLSGLFSELPVSLYGLYGLERCVGGVFQSEPGAEEWRAVTAEVFTKACRELPSELRIEDNRLVVSLNCRRDPSLMKLIYEWARRQAASYGLALQCGRMIVELRPPLRLDKGTVISEEIRDLACAWYLGDDLSDQPAFRALQSRTRNDSGFLGFCVSVLDNGVRTIPAGSVDFELDSPREVASFLKKALGVFAKRAGFNARRWPKAGYLHRKGQ